MKKSLIFALALFTHTAYSQNSGVAQTQKAQTQNVASKQHNEETTKTKIDALIKKEQVKTGILYNRTTPFVGLHSFGQKESKDASNFQHFKQAYFEVQTAAYSTEKMMDMDGLNGWIRFKADKNIVPVGVMLYDMDYCEALGLDKISEGNLTPKSSNELLIKQLQTIVISPLAKNNVLVGKMITFELSKELFLTNSLLTIEKLSVDFGEGNLLQTLRLGDNCQVKFATAGTKILRFELLLSNGKKHTTYATLEVL